MSMLPRLARSLSPLPCIVRDAFTVKRICALTFSTDADVRAQPPNDPTVTHSVLQRVCARADFHFKPGMNFTDETASTSSEQAFDLDTWKRQFAKAKLSEAMYFL